MCGLVEYILFGSSDKGRAPNIIDGVIEKHKLVFEDLAKHDNKESLRAVTMVSNLSLFAKHYLKGNT